MSKKINGLCYMAVVIFFLSALIMTSCSKTGSKAGNQTETPTEGAQASHTGEEGVPSEPGERVAAAEAPPIPTQTPVEKQYDIVYTLYNTESRYADLSQGPLIAGYNVLDCGADPTGTEDNTRLFQSLINQLGAVGGGTIYIPEGLYRIDGTLRIMRGVTLRGDWIKPEKEAAVEGTVLLAYAGREQGPTDAPFIEMEIGAGVMDLAIWYPEQEPQNIVAYSPTIRMGVDDYFGNEYNNVKNVTLVNAYIGVLFSYTNGGASPVVNGLYGTPLAVGVEIDNIADVGRIERLYFSPEYWINCGLYAGLGIDDPFINESNAKSVRNFTYDNGTGLIMRRNDWSYATFLRVEGYCNGFLGASSIASPGATPNGHHYDFYFKNCRNGVNIESTNDVGILFNKVITEGCETGLRLGGGTTGAVQFANCILDAKAAVDIDESSATKFLLNDSTVTSGRVLINGGTFEAADTDFLNKKDNAHMEIGSFGRANLAGCRFNGEPDIYNHSVYLCGIDHTPLAVPQAPEYDDLGQVVKTPTRPVLYIATDPLFGAIANDPSTDNSVAVQLALDTAAAEGGGYVYLPSGKYRFASYLIIPSGVELVGGQANSAVPHGEGAILECAYGQNDPDASAFLQIHEGGGIRNLTIDYPLQVYEPSDNYTPDYYPFAIQGQGSDVYVINIGVRACYAALDLFTYRCDNFYVDFLAGHMFNNGVRVGGNSENGVLSNLMCNIIVYACGRETKFGSFQNSPADGVSNKPLYEYGLLNLDFLILGDCKDLTLYNCFNYGSYRGITLRDDGSGGPQDCISMGFGLDGDTYAIYVEEGVTTKDFALINTQVVTLTEDYSPRDTSYFYSAGHNDFDITLYTSDYWGAPVYGVYMGEDSGTLRLLTAHFRAAGQTLAHMNGGRLDIFGSSIESLFKLWDGLVGANERIYITGSILRDSGIDLNIAAFDMNIPLMRSFAPEN